MTITAVLILIAIGLVLILSELLVLPGTNVAGILGILLMVAGIYFGYKDIGTPVAHFILGGSFVFMIGAVVLVLRSNTWENISLSAAINSKVNNKKLSHTRTLEREPKKVITMRRTKLPGKQKLFDTPKEPPKQAQPLSLTKIESIGLEKGYWLDAV